MGAHVQSVDNDVTRLVLRIGGLCRTRVCWNTRPAAQHGTGCTFYFR